METYPPTQTLEDSVTLFEPKGSVIQVRATVSLEIDGEGNVERAVVNQQDWHRDDVLSVLTDQYRSESDFKVSEEAWVAVCAQEWPVAEWQHRA